MEVGHVTTRESRTALAFEEFFRSEYPRLRGAMYLITGRAEEAEELAQEAMARALERWDRVGMMESPGGYVYRAALNLNRQRLRNLRVRARRLLSLGHTTDQDSQAEISADLSLALEALPRGQREALILVEWVGLSSEEAGRILELEAASIRSRVHRAKVALRSRLGELGD